MTLTESPPPARPLFPAEPTSFVMLPSRPDPLGEVAAPKPRKPAKRPRKEPVATLPGKGSRQSHEKSKQSRKAPWRSDVVRAKVRPLTPKQRTWLLREASAAWKHQRSVSRDDRSFDVFRHDVIAETTAGHHAGQVDGLTKANDRHFDCLMAAFLVLKGKRGDALKWAEKDDPEAQRLDHTRHMIRELLKKLEPLPYFVEQSAETDDQRNAFANTFSQRLYGKDWERLDADQADYFYRQLKPAMTREAMAKRAAAWTAKQGDGEKVLPVLNACRCGDPKPCSNDTRSSARRVVASSRAMISRRLPSAGTKEGREHEYPERRSGGKGDRLDAALSQCGRGTGIHDGDRGMLCRVPREGPSCRTQTREGSMEGQDTVREELYNCPLCDRRNFSARGLQGHRCTSPELLACLPFGLILARPKLPPDLIAAIIEDDTKEVADLVAAIKAPKPEVRK